MRLPSEMNGRSIDRTGGHWPIRGREPELSALRGAVERVGDGSPVVVLIEGGAGFGKSRLLAEVAAEAQRNGLTVSLGGADPEDRESPFATLLAALSSGESPVLTPTALSALRELKDDRYWFLLEIEAAIERAAMSTGLVVGLDDAQWADGQTLDAVRKLAGHFASLPILWVLAFRPRHDSRALGRLVAELDNSSATRIELEPLSAAAVRQVIVDRTGGEYDERVVELMQRADGVPFFLVDLLRGALDGGLVDRDGRVAPAVSSRSLAGIAERLGRLSAPAGHVAQLGAVLGRVFRTDDVATMLNVGTSTLLGAFAELVQEDVLTELGEKWTFRHDLVREAVLDRLATPMRHSLERAAADVLLAAGIPPIDVARRIAAGAEPGDRRAIETLLSAARSLVGTDPGTAVELNLTALRLIPLGDPIRAAVAAETVVGLHLAGHDAEALQLADEVSPELSDGQQFAELQLSISRMLTLPGSTRAECGRRGLAAHGISDVLRARLLAVLVLSEAVSGDTDGAAQTAVAAKRQIESIGDDVAELQLEFSQMTLDAATGAYSNALARVPTIRRLVDETGDSVPGLSMEWVRANVLVTLDHFQQAWALSATALENARRDRQAWMVTSWEMWQGWYLSQRGRLSESRALLEGVLVAEGMQVATALKDAIGVATLGRVARHLGDHRLTAWCTNVAVQSLTIDIDDDGRRHLGWFLATQAIANDDIEAARRHLDAGCHGGSRLPLLPAEVGIETATIRVARALGDREREVRAVSDAVRRADHNPHCASLAAAALHARGLHEGSVELLRSAADQFGGGVRTLLAASAFEDLGCVLKTRGNDAEAVESFVRALELNARLGADWDARRLRRRLRGMGVNRRMHSSSRPTSGWGSLTPSELVVARLVGEGKSNRAVAEALYVSPNTVSAHLRHIFEKLHINSRVELARIVDSPEHPA